MFKLLLSTLFFVNVSFVALEAAETVHKNRMLADLDFIKKTFEESYAPAEWKKELFSWDLQSKIQSTMDEVNKNKGNDIKQFHKSLIKFCRSARDYHVSILFTSTEYASLPFDMRCRNGKYILTKVKKKETQLEIGDEILTIDGIPVETVVAELQIELGEENKAATDRALALEVLTRRNGRLGHQVPQGSITVEVKRCNSGNIETHQVAWNYKPERISNPFINSFTETIKEKEPSHQLLEEKFDRNSAIPYYAEMSEAFPNDDLPSDLLGSRKSVFSALGQEKIPELGEKANEEQIAWLWKWIWQKEIPENAKEFFDAKLIELPSGKSVGYVRISTFMEEDPAEALKAFLSCIKYFQSEADMLLIDLTNNPGGSVFYMYALASALTDRPLVALKERRLLTQNDVFKAIETIDDFQDIDLVKEFGNTTLRGFLVRELFQNLINEAHYILNQWEVGHLLTDPYPFKGIEVIKPHPKAHFTKPIFILVNEMSFSCGDDFPAIFQDNKRATIIGTPTAGAGGGISKLSFTNLNGISQLGYTTSITHRLDGTPLENKGVTPDIFFDFNNELYDHDNVSPDFSKIYGILDTMTQGSQKDKTWGWLD